MAKHGAKIKQEQRATIGQRVLYAGMVDSVCPSCGSVQRKGMMTLYKDKRFCNEMCAKRSDT